MTTTSINITSRVLKAALTGVCLYTLAACGATTSSTPAALTSTHASISRDTANAVAALKKNSLTFTEDGKNITITRAGKTYKFTNAEFKTTGATTEYLLTSGDEVINLQNLSTNFLKSEKKYTTDNVNLWFMNIANSGIKTSDQGYLAIGTKSTSVPTSSTSSYNGGLTGYMVNKTDGTELFISADSKLTADFTAQTMAGDFDNFEMLDPITGDVATSSTTMSIVNGKISSTGFSGELTFSDTIAITSSAIEGSFYGNGAPEVAGIGQFESIDTVGTFGFTAKK